MSKGHNYNNRMGMIRQLNMQKRDTRECLFQAMDGKARLAATKEIKGKTKVKNPKKCDT